MLLAPHQGRLHSLRIILASQSPRRQELLERCGLAFEVVPSLFEETLNKADFATPADYVVENARRKAIETTERLRSASEAGKALLVIGSDTVVVHDGAILEKPRSEDEARRMLRSLAGTGHEVFTGVALVHVGADGREDTHAFSERTEVEFGAVTDAAIDAYVASGEPMDKAGAYGIQGAAATFVSGITGCYYNVMGLPLHRFCRELGTALEGPWQG